MEYKTFKEIFVNIFQSDSVKTQCYHLPNWWAIILQSIETNGNPENIQNHDSQLIGEKHPWFTFSKVMQKVINFWQRKWNKWQSLSWTTLVDEKLSLLPGDIFQTSFCSQDAESLQNLWISYANMENPDEQECSEFQSKKIISTLSTIAPTAQDVVDVHSKKKLDLLASLDQIVGTTNHSGNSREPTGTMSSSISFLKNGELVKYGLEEKVGKYRLTVSYHSR